MTHYADRLIAHRGWRSHYPENTLPAIEAALSVGAKHVEIDIQLSADKVPMLFHDYSLHRLCQRNDHITSLNANELQQLLISERERLKTNIHDSPMATLEDCLQLMCAYPDAQLYIEIKEESIDHFGTDCVLKQVLDVIQRSSAASQCMIISYHEGILQAARDQGWQPIALVLSTLEQGLKGHDLNPDLLFCDLELVHELEDISILAAPAAIFEIADFTLAKTWFERGATLIETFAIGEMIEDASNN